MWHIVICFRVVPNIAGPLVQLGNVLVCQLPCLEFDSYLRKWLMSYLMVHQLVDFALRIAYNLLYTSTSLGKSILSVLAKRYYEFGK